MQARNVKISLFKRICETISAEKCIVIAMGRKKIEVSDFDKEISRAIRSGMGVRRLSGRALSRQIGRSETYIRSRIKDEAEWTLSDIELICQSWSITPDQLLNQ